MAVKAVTVYLSAKGLRLIEVLAYNQYLEGHTASPKLATALRALVNAEAEKTSFASDGHPCAHCKENHGAPFCMARGIPL